MLAKSLYLEPKKTKDNIPTKHLTKIEKVRIRVNDNSLVPINETETAFVATGSNHHICLFEIFENDKPKRYAVFTTRMEANQRLCEQQRRLRKKRQELKEQGLTGAALEKSLRDYRRIVVTRDVPIVQRLDPDQPTAKFLFTLKRGELFKIKVKNKNNQEIEIMAILKKSSSPAKRTFFVEQRDARKKPKLISKSGGTYLDIVEKLVVDRLGNTFRAGED